MACTMISLPEQNEGREENFVCKVLSTEKNMVEQLIYGKGLGVQGSDEGIRIIIFPEFDEYKWEFVMPVLTIDELESAIKEQELNYYKIIYWQRRGFLGNLTLPMIDRKNKIIKTAHGHQISKLFEKMGYQIIRVHS